MQRSIRVITLRDMTEAEFATFQAWLIEDYAHDIARNSQVPADEALASSQQQIAELLPHGRASANQWLFAVVAQESGEMVGYLWCQVELERRRAFILDIQIFETARGHGYGIATLLELEQRLRAHSIERIGLHVFGDNVRAQALYRRLGYRITGIQMQKELDDR
jgi:ribosomal protein S18 acetylase RimI-like enzyme